MSEMNGGIREETKVLETDARLLGQRLRALREERNLTQQQVADYIGANRSSYTYYESGRTIPHLSALVKMADLFGLQTSQLIKILLAE